MHFEKETIGNITQNLDRRRIPLNSKQRSEKKVKGLYPYYGANNILDYIDEFIFDEKILCVAEDGGSWGAQERCAYIVHEKCWVNNHAHVLKENGKAHLEYLYFYLNYANLNKYITGSTRGKLTRNELEKIVVPLPSLIDQKRIAKVLSDCEALIQKRKESIDLLDELLKSTFLEMFGKRIGEETKLENIIDIQEGLVDPNENPYNEMYHVGGANIESNSGKLVNLKKAKNERLISGKYLFEPNFLLYSKIRPYLNKVAIVDFSGICSADIYPLKLKYSSTCNLHFLRYELQSDRFLNYASKHSGRANIPKINRKVLNNYKTILPPPSIQNEFGRIVENVDSIKDYYNQSLKELENLYGSLSQRAFKGELDLSKVGISDIEDIETEDPELEPDGEPRWEGKGEFQDYRVHIDQIIKRDFNGISFSFKQLEEAISNRGVYVPYEGVKSFIFESLEGDKSFLVQELDDKDKEILFKIRP